VVSEVFEIIDAIARPYIAQVIVHPVLSVTTCVFVVLALTLVYRLFRLNDFSRGESLLFSAFLASTPGFLSNLFVYIRPAKPISFVVLAALLLWLFRYAADPRPARLPILFLLLVTGLFTDELLLFAIGAVVVAVVLLGAQRQVVPVAATALAAAVTWALAIFIVLPIVYDAFGPGGARTVSLSEGSDPTAWRMLSYIYSKRLYLSGIEVAARTIAACFGLYQNSAGTIALGCAVMLAAVTALIVFFRRRGEIAWKLAAIGFVGLLSFSAFGMWLHWYHQPGTLEDHVALNYYYNSPVSIFVVLLAAASFKAVQAWLSRKSPQRVWLATIAAAGVIAGAVSINITRFPQLNAVERMFQLGPTDVEATFREMNRPRSVGEPPTVIVTGGADRLEAMLLAYNTLGRKLFGDGWEESNLYRDRALFEHTMPYFSKSYAHFGYHYGIRLCLMYFGEGPCPVTFRETPDAAARPPVSSLVRETRELERTDLERHLQE
jgi:hypothetical protein